MFKLKSPLWSFYIWLGGTKTHGGEKGSKTKTESMNVKLRHCGRSDHLRVLEGHEWDILPPELWRDTHGQEEVQNLHICMILMW